MKKFLNIFLIAAFSAFFLTSCGEATDSKEEGDKTENAEGKGDADAHADDHGDTHADHDHDAGAGSEVMDAGMTANNLQDMLYEDEEGSMGKTVMLKGVVAKKWAYADSNEPVLSFADAEDNTYHIIDAVFADEATIAGIEVGQEVTVKGTVEGFEIGTVVLKNCELK